MEAQQRRSCLDTAPVGLKESGSLNGTSLLAKTGFHWDFNHQILGPLCALCTILPYLQGGRLTLARLLPAQRARTDEVMIKEQFSVASRLAVTSFGEMLALPRCS